MASLESYEVARRRMEASKSEWIVRDCNGAIAGSRGQGRVWQDIDKRSSFCMHELTKGGQKAQK